MVDAVEEEVHPRGRPSAAGFAVKRERMRTGHERDLDRMIRPVVEPGDLARVAGRGREHVAFVEKHVPGGVDGPGVGAEGDIHRALVAAAEQRHARQVRCRCCGGEGRRRQEHGRP